VGGDLSKFKIKGGGVRSIEIHYKETDTGKRMDAHNKYQERALGRLLWHDHIHIPKTGGVSICKALHIHNSHDTLHWRIVNYNHFYKIKTISTFVRDPWQRALSWFLYSGHCRQYDSFEDWILKGMDDHWKWNKDNPRMLFQEDWFLHEDNTNKIDFWGRFENFEEDYHKLCDYLKLEEHPDLPHHHDNYLHHDRSPQYKEYEGYKNDYTPFWNDAMRKIADPKFKYMRERFGYEFGKVCER
jgi:hypothetical protein